MATVAGSMHPKWKENWWWWEFYRLSYVGGKEYMSPSITQRWWFPKRSTTDEGVNRIRYEEGDLYSFLFRHGREENSDYDRRVLRSYYRNLTRPVVDTYAAHVYSKPVLREYASVPELSEVAEKADGNQSTIDEFMQAGLKWAQVYGHVFCVVDMPELQPGELVTRADEQERALRPYATWYSPLSVIDWEVDRYGRFLWVKLIEGDLRKLRVSAKDMRGPQYASLFRTWYADRWELHETAGNAQGQMIATGPNPIGRVPVEVLYGQRIAGETEPVGQSRIGDIAVLNREIYNLDSLKQDMNYNQAFAFLVVPDKSGLVNAVDVGTTRSLTVNPDSGGMPQYVGPPVEYVQNLRDEIADLILQIRAMAGLSRGVGEQSIAARSGDALLIETHDKAVMLLSLAHEAQDFETRFWRLASRWLGSEWDGTVRYPDNYEVNTLGDDIDVALKFNQLNPPALAKAKVAETVMRRLLSSIAPDELDAIVAELHKQATMEEGIPSNGA